MIKEFMYSVGSTSHRAKGNFLGEISKSLRKIFGCYFRPGKCERVIVWVCVWQKIKEKIYFIYHLNNHGKDYFIFWINMLFSLTWLMATYVISGWTLAIFRFIILTVTKDWDIILTKMLANFFSLRPYVTDI